jgi:hypothetical protein
MMDKNKKIGTLLILTGLGLLLIPLAFAGNYFPMLGLGNIQRMKIVLASKIEGENYYYHTPECKERLGKFKPKPPSKKKGLFSNIEWSDERWAREQDVDVRCVRGASTYSAVFFALAIVAILAGIGAWAGVLPISGKGSEDAP